MTSETVNVSKVPFAEVGRVTHEGRTFEAMGAVEYEGVLYAYVNKDDSITNWDGSETFGCVIRSHYYDRWSHGMPGKMRCVRVRRTDGSVWFGRYGSDWSMLVRLRPLKKGG